MRFVTFRDAEGARAGVLPEGRDDVVLDLAHPAVAAALGGRQAAVGTLIAHGLDDVVARLAAAGTPDGALLPLSEVTLEAPFTLRRVFGIAHNYRCALAERGMPHPEKPVLFMKDPGTTVGPGAEVVLPKGVGGCTYEAELAVVIGRRADKVSHAEARRYVAGYSIYNDVSASEIIRADGAFERGKNVATFGPLGPWLASADEIPDPHALAITLEVGGAVRQNGTTADLLFDVDALISILSQDRPLEPGDLIATGTPAGVAPVQTPQTWLVPGTIMRATVEKLGVLENPVVERGEWRG